MFSPHGPLSREELDLLQFPADSLLVDALLPSESVQIGSSWQHHDDTLALLLGLDAVGHSEVSSQLVSVTDGQARLELSGTVHGAIAGVSTEIELKARYRFDMKWKRITRLELAIKEKRSIGHVGARARRGGQITMQSRARDVDAPRQVGTLRPALEAQRATTHLNFESTGGHFRFLHGRQWFVTADTDKMAVPANGRAWRAGCPMQRQHDGPTARRTDHPAQGLPAGYSNSRWGRTSGNSSAPANRPTLVASGSIGWLARGIASDLPVEWIYCLVADRQGRRAVAVFTIESTLVERFARQTAILSAIWNCCRPRRRHRPIVPDQFAAGRIAPADNPAKRATQPTAARPKTSTSSKTAIRKAAKSHPRRSARFRR